MKGEREIDLKDQIKEVRNGILEIKKILKEEWRKKMKAMELRLRRNRKGIKRVKGEKRKRKRG